MQSCVVIVGCCYSVFYVLLLFLFSVCYILLLSFGFFFFFKQKTAYEMRISDWSSDVCSSDLVNNHISLRVPGTDDQFLINPYNFLWEQITASSLIKIDVDGNRLDDSPNEVNKAGFVIHSAIHMGRKDLHCVIHTHTVAGMAVSALDCGLLPLNQGAMRWYNRIGTHDFEGIALNARSEARRVGHACASTCSTRVPPYQQKN